MSPASARHELLGINHTNTLNPSKMYPLFCAYAQSTRAAGTRAGPRRRCGSCGKLPPERSYPCAVASGRCRRCLTARCRRTSARLPRTGHRLAPPTTPSTPPAALTPLIRLCTFLLYFGIAVPSCMNHRNLWYNVHYSCIHVYVLSVGSLDLPREVLPYPRFFPCDFQLRCAGPALPPVPHCSIALRCVAVPSTAGGSARAHGYTLYYSNI